MGNQPDFMDKHIEQLLLPWSMSGYHKLRCRKFYLMFSV